jgi:hypothetical protein
LMRCMQQFSGRRIGRDRKSVASVWRTCQGEWREVREEKRIEEANQGKRLTSTLGNDEMMMVDGGQLSELRAMCRSETKRSSR